MTKSQITKDYLIGLLAGLGFNFLAAIQEVYLGSRLQNIPVPVYLFGCFATILTLFFFLSFARGQKSGRAIGYNQDFVKRIKKDFKDIFIINFYTIFIWVPYFFAIQYIEPAIEAAITLAIGPVIVLLLEVYVYRKNMSKLDVVISIGALVGVLFLGFIGQAGKSALSIISTEKIIIGVLCSAAAGTALALITTVSKKLYTQGWAPSELIGVRFFLLVFLTMPFLPAGWFQFISNNIVEFLTVAIFGIVAPVYLGQVLLKKTSSFTTAVVCTANPAFTILFQLFDSRLQFSIYSLVGVLICMFFVSLGALNPSK
ncbi:MAG: EamA family transporter [Bacteriovoracia bacterium]